MAGQVKGFTPSTLVTFAREVGRVDTSPGLPWIALGCHTIDDVLIKFSFQLCEAVRQRIYTRLNYTLTEARLATPSYLVQTGYRDVVRVFVKNEPHSAKKLAEGRLRLIMNPSLTDILVDRILLEPLARAEVAVWDTIPSKAGMGLDDPSIERLRAGLPPSLFSSDAKAWDFTVPEWLMDAAAEVEVRQYGLDPTSDAFHLCFASSVATNRKVWSLANGILYEQLTPGIQESGSRMTACRNSKMRVLLALACGADACFAMGDDALEVWPNGFNADAYQACGFTVELPELPSGVEFEFCSTHFTADAAIPTSWPRVLYRLLGHKPDPLLLQQFKYELRAHPRLPELLRFVEQHWL